MTDTYLSPAELRELTGCAHRARQVAWLKSQQWPHAIAETGHVRVLREYWHARPRLRDVGAGALRVRGQGVGAGE